MQPLTATTDELITLAEAAKRCGGKGISRQTVWRWAEAGVLIQGVRIKLESIRIGGRYFTTAAALERFTRLGNDPATPTPQQTKNRSSRRKQLDRDGI